MVSNVNIFHLKNWGYSIFLLIFSSQIAFSQEFKYTLSINSDQAKIADQAVFKSLEKSLLDFLNSQKWTDVEFNDYERIDCQLNIIITEDVTQKDFKGKLNIVATRPVYNSDYQTIIFQHSENNLIFSYDQGTNFIFSENSYNDQLTSILAFYSYIILGVDRDSYSNLGGDILYSKAQNVFNNIPQNFLSSADYGWQTTSAISNKSRYFFLENLQSPKLIDFRSACYEYYRQGLDISYKDVKEGRKNMLNAIKLIEKSYDGYINSLMINTFLAFKTREINDIFMNGDRNEKSDMYRTIAKMNQTAATNLIDLK